MIIFESLLTTFEVSVIFVASFCLETVQITINKFNQVKLTKIVDLYDQMYNACQGLRPS